MTNDQAPMTNVTSIWCPIELEKIMGEAGYVRDETVEIHAS